MSDSAKVPSLPMYQKPLVRMDAKIPESIMKSVFPKLPKPTKPTPKKKK